MSLLRPFFFFSFFFFFQSTFFFFLVLLLCFVVPGLGRQRAAVYVWVDRHCRLHSDMIRNWCLFDSTPYTFYICRYILLWHWRLLTKYVRVWWCLPLSLGELDSITVRFGYLSPSLPLSQLRTSYLLYITSEQIRVPSRQARWNVSRRRRTNFQPDFLDSRESESAARCVQGQIDINEVVRKPPFWLCLPRLFRRKSARKIVPGCVLSILILYQY